MLVSGPQSQILDRLSLANSRSVNRGEGLAIECHSPCDNARFLKREPGLAPAE